jgi:uncharacterized protein
MAMDWRDLLFMHWPVEVARLRLFVPPALEIETFDGTAWLGVVPCVPSMFDNPEVEVLWPT